MLNEILKKLRGERKLSQKEISDALNIAQPSYANYESGNRSPDYDMLIKIAKFYNVTTDYLLGVAENRTFENAEIGKLTGLSDRAVEKLGEYNSNFYDYHNIVAVNYLLETGVLLEELTKYLLTEYRVVENPDSKSGDDKNDKYRHLAMFVIEDIPYSYTSSEVEMDSEAYEIITRDRLMEELKAARKSLIREFKEARKKRERNVYLEMFLKDLSEYRDKAREASDDGDGNKA